MGYDAVRSWRCRGAPSISTQRPKSARPTGAPHRAAAGLVNAYTYDGVGNLKSMTDATGTVSYGYNAVNRATSVVEPGGFTTTFAYDDDNNRTTTAYPNGVTQRATTTPRIASPASRAPRAPAC